MKKINRINYQKSAYHKRLELKSVIYLKSVNACDNYILPSELKLVNGARHNNDWYRLHIPEENGWSEGICRLTKDLNDENIYNGILHFKEYSVLISIFISTKLHLCYLKAFQYYNPKELRLLPVA